MPIAPNISKLTSDWDADRHSKKGWTQFLESVTMEGLRGWTDESVEFRYPIVALAGENGAGKSTVLKAIAAAYRVTNAAAKAGAVTYSPDDFFPNTPWEKVEGVTLTYGIRDGNATTPYQLRKATSRWRGAPERAYRGVFFLDISRIQPANTLIGYGRLAQQAIARDKEPVSLDAGQLKSLNRILGRSYGSGVLHKDSSKQVGILETGGIKYSNFHQGAGEDATLDLVALLNTAPNGSLVLIDEAEASLHPKAQRRLVTELVELATKKRLQIVLSTHSALILEQLPPVARILVTVDRENRRELIYGATAEYSLSLMDDSHHPELDVYCEDPEAAYLTETLVGMDAADERNRMRFIAVGPASAVKIMGGLSASGRLRGKGIGVLDPDMEQTKGCIVLPGSQAPEKEIYCSMTDTTWKIVAERLGVAPGALLDAAADAMQLENHHLWSKEIARLLSPSMRPHKVWEAAVDVWSKDILSVADRQVLTSSLVEALNSPQ